MTDQKADLFETKRGAAVLAACIVQTLNESDPSFQERFLTNLDRSYRDLREMGDENVQGLELLSWVREILRQA